MRATDTNLGSSSIAVATAATVLAFPPTLIGMVSRWNGGEDTIPEFDLEVWANLPVDLTAAELFGASLQSFVYADSVLDSVTNATNTLTKTAHALLTGDGPVRFASTLTYPTGLATGTDYWVIKTGANTYKLAASLELAYAGTAVDFSTDGSGVFTVSDTASTKRVHWHSFGLLGPAFDGSITLDAQRSYTARCSHRTRVFAYGMIATLSTETPENVSIAIVPVQDA